MSESNQAHAAAGQAAVAAVPSEDDLRSAVKSLPIMLCLEHAATHWDEYQDIITSFRDNRLNLIRLAFKSSPLMVRDSLTHRTAVACLLNIIRQPEKLNNLETVREALDWLEVISPAEHFPRDVNSVFFFIATEIKVQSILACAQEDKNGLVPYSEEKFASAMSAWFGRISPPDLFCTDSTGFQEKVNVMRTIRGEIKKFWSHLVSGNLPSAAGDLSSSMSADATLAQREIAKLECATFLKRHSIHVLEQTIQNYGMYTARALGYYSEESLLDLLVRTYLPQFFLQNPSRVSEIGLDWARKTAAAAGVTQGPEAANPEISSAPTQVNLAIGSKRAADELASTTDELRTTKRVSGVIGPFDEVAPLEIDKPAQHDSTSGASSDPSQGQSSDEKKKETETAIYKALLKALRTVELKDLERDKQLNAIRKSDEALQNLSISELRVRLDKIQKTPGFESLLKSPRG